MNARFRLSLVPAIVVLAVVPAAAQATWYVDGTHPGCPGSGTLADPFCTIGDAVLAAAPGDTIEVGPGTYAEQVVIDTNDLSLRGAGAGVTTIVGGPSPSTVVGIEPGFPVPGDVTEFAISGFRITTAEADPVNVTGIRLNPSSTEGASWHVDRCIIEGCTTAVSVNNSFNGSSTLIENSVLVDGGVGVAIYGEDTTIRNCTIANMSIGVASTGPCCSDFEISNTIIAFCDSYAVGRTSSESTNLHNLVVYSVNQDNPPSLPDAGPFMEVLHEGNGFWFEFTPFPGPVSTADPAFVDRARNDVRLLGGSSALEGGDPATPLDPARPYDVYGFGHLRLDDGDFDAAEQLDIGANEFGGLVANRREVAAGQLVSLRQWGPPGQLVGLFVGPTAGPFELGIQGSLFLDPGQWVLLAVGTLPGGGEVEMISGPAPAELVGISVPFQGVRQGPIDLHWTNLETVTITP